MLISGKLCNQVIERMRNLIDLQDGYPDNVDSQLLEKIKLVLTAPKLLSGRGIELGKDIRKRLEEIETQIKADGSAETKAE